MSAPRYIACGKQVFRNGEHFADAVTPAAAILIVVGLGGTPSAPNPEIVHRVAARCAQADLPVSDCGVAEVLRIAAEEASRG